MILRNIKLLTWLYLLILVLGAVLPLDKGEVLGNTYVLELRSDYLIHVLISLPLPLLIALSLRHLGGLWIRVLVFSILIVSFCEGIQLLIPYRTFNINDLLANGVGALLGLVAAFIVWRRIHKATQAPRFPVSGSQI